MAWHSFARLEGALGAVFQGVWCAVGGASGVESVSEGGATVFKESDGPAQGARTTECSLHATASSRQVVAQRARNPTRNAKQNLKQNSKHNPTCKQIYTKP